MAKIPVHSDRLVIHHPSSHSKEIIGETAQLLLTQVWARLKETSKSWGGKNKKVVPSPLIAWKGQEERREQLLKPQESNSYELRSRLPGRSWEFW